MRNTTKYKSERRSCLRCLRCLRCLQHLLQTHTTDAWRTRRVQSTYTPLTLILPSLCTVFAARYMNMKLETLHKTACVSYSIVSYSVVSCSIAPVSCRVVCMSACMLVWRAVCTGATATATAAAASLTAKAKEKKKERKSFIHTNLKIKHETKRIHRGERGSSFWLKGTREIETCSCMQTRNHTWMQDDTARLFIRITEYQT